MGAALKPYRCEDLHPILPLVTIKGKLAGQSVLDGTVPRLTLTAHRPIPCQHGAAKKKIHQIGFEIPLSNLVVWPHYRWAPNERRRE